MRSALPSSPQASRREKHGGMPQPPFSAGKEAAVSQQAAERGGAERVAPPDPLDEDPFVDIFKIFNKDK